MERDVTQSKTEEMKAIKIESCAVCPYREQFSKDQKSVQWFCTYDPDNRDFPELVNYPAIPTDCELEDHHPDTGKAMDKILNSITPEQQAKCDADMIEVLERKAFEAARELHPTKFAYRKYKTFEEWKEAAQ